MNEDAAKILEAITQSGLWQEKLVMTISVILLAALLHWLASRLITRHIADVRRHYYAQQVAKYAVYIIGFILIARTWFEGITSIATFLGLIGAGLVIAMNDVVKNLIGFAFVLWRRPFTVGDRIQIGESVGDVIDIRMFQTLIIEVQGPLVNAYQTSGRILHLPNSKFLTEPLANFDKGFQYIWIELPVAVTFESDWVTAKKLFYDIAQKHSIEVSQKVRREFQETSKQFLVHFSNLEAGVFTTVVDFGVNLTLRLLCRPRTIREVQQRVWEDLLHALAEHDNIDLAYPTTRLFSNVLEGKPQAKAELPFLNGHKIKAP